MRLYLEEADLWTKRKTEVIQRINQTGLPLVLFGRAYPVNSSLSISKAAIHEKSSVCKGFGRYCPPLFPCLFPHEQK